MPLIHSTAIVSPEAEFAENVEIGPYCILSGRIRIGPGTVIKAHSVLEGELEIGQRCTIGPGAYVGVPPQHLKYAGESTHCIIGDQVIIREGASVHRSFQPGREHATRVGNRCFLMAGSHVGHDTVLGDDITMANASLCGGHVTVGNRAFLGGGSALHQFVRVGRLAIVGGNERVSRDVPPFAAVRFDGLRAYNVVGVRRAGIDRESAHAIRQAYQCLHTHRNFSQALEAIRSKVTLTPEVREILDFIATAKRGVLPSYQFTRAISDAGEE